MYIVIRAGGVGTRLWPMSRNAKPKQLHALTSHKTMLQEAIDRVLDVVPPEQIYVSCNQQSEDIIRAELGAVLEHNLIIEPALRDTAAAVGLETITIARQHPDAIIASLGSDHIIKDTAEFQRILCLAEHAVQERPHHIVCIGIKTDHPDTGYGYIELAEPVAEEIFTVSSFKEKPDYDTAKKFVAAGNYLWNANMFVWRADTLLRLYEKHMPAMFAQLQHMQVAPAVIPELYPQLEKVAIDYAIIEKAKNILAIPGQFGWSDIGDWARLKDELASTEVDNVSRGDHIDKDSKNALVISESKRLIATIGLRDVIIVDTEDALLVCDKFHSQQVKDIVEQLKRQQRDDLL
jgi:mannose-1-phosphate guanylyltransferase